MSYVVTWTRHALRQYLGLWTTATDPDAVDAASLRINQTLATDADQQGQAGVGPLRILIDAPLVVLFVADADIGLAYVVSVAWSGQPA